MSCREAARIFGIDRRTVDKMLVFSVPPGYRRKKKPVRPKLDGFTGIIDQILEADKLVHKKQRHTSKRIFECLRDEHGFVGGMDVSFCLEVLEEAFDRYGQPEIFNTHQGSQFTSFDFTSVLKERGIKISMDGKGHWMDNVFIERLWRSLKYEYVYLNAFDCQWLASPAEYWRLADPL